MPNTKISYMYRDASNHKQAMTIVLAEAISDEDKKRIHAKLDDVKYFIPSQIGLEDLQGRFHNGLDFEEDHVWHELTSIQPTDATPTTTMSAAELVSRFNAVNQWDVTGRWDEMLAQMN